MGLPPLNISKCSSASLGLEAAELELHVAIGALSQQIKALQASLGIELFEKRGRQLAIAAGHNSCAPPSACSLLDLTLGEMD